MRWAVVVLALSLSGCSALTSTRIVDGPAPVRPSDNPSITTAEPVEMGWVSKALVIGGLGLVGWVLWKWDD